jgi:hypothetical protein
MGEDGVLLEPSLDAGASDFMTALEKSGGTPSSFALLS